MKVLVAEDEAISRHVLEVRLKGWGYEPVLVRDGQEAWEVLRRPDAPRLAVLDWMMPGLDGPELCRRVRCQAQEPYIYVLLLTGKQAKADIVEGLEAGADDYVTKPFDAQELHVRLRVGKRIVALQTEVVEARESLRFQATHDALTGTRNRGALMEALGREVTRARRDGTSVAVALADLDHFKAVNDAHGHLAGDAVLRAAAGRMNGLTRPYDVLGRYGGEEFLLVMPGCPQGPAAGVADRLRRSLCASPIVHDGRSISITGSFGVASASGADLDGERLISRADDALYAAKRAGRNRVIVADPAGLPRAHPHLAPAAPPPPGEAPPRPRSIFPRADVG